MQKQLIIGCGTGRCGTKSLSRFLNSQKTALCSHELEFLSPRFLPIWDQNEKEILHHLEDLISQTNEKSLKYIGDVAMFYLPYVDAILEKWPNTIFICLQREKSKTVQSFMKKTVGGDFWRSSLDYQNTWSDVFPKFKASSKKESVEMYWDFYYEEAYRLSLKFPQSFYVVPTEELNTEKGMRNILLKSNIQPIDHVVDRNFHENKNLSRKKDILFLYLKIKMVTFLKKILHKRIYYYLRGVYYYLKDFTFLQKATP
jgi:hypothetical protein